MKNRNHDCTDPVEPERDETGDHQQFVELCAVAMAGPLRESEAVQLRTHLEECQECREAMAEFRFIAVEGASLLAPIETDGAEPRVQRLPLIGPSLRTGLRCEKAVKQELFARIAASADADRRSPIRGITASVSWQTKLQFSVALLVLLAGVGVGAYKFGTVDVARVPAESTQSPTRQEHLRSELSDAEKQLEIRAASIDDLTRKLQDRTETAQDLRRRLADVLFADKNNEAQVNAILSQNATIESERDKLLKQLQDAQTSLISLRSELESLRASKRDDLALILSLQARIENLSGHLEQSQETVAQQQEFLVSDRDIRELMGARNLYITDVVDVDKNGQTQKPFGRIFYTRGKSLIFYAFDLDQQRGLHNAAFQLWGQRGSDRSSAVNMGIFYLDNEANRRWVLKFDNPDKLAEINAVFVTVESNGPSPRPAGKQLLYASLRTFPNHP